MASACTDTEVKRSNCNPNPRVRVLTFAMGMGRDVEQRECACRYDFTSLYSLVTSLTKGVGYVFAGVGK